MLIARNEKGLAPCEWPHKFKRSNCVWTTSPVKTDAILLGFQPSSIVEIKQVLDKSTAKVSRVIDWLRLLVAARVIRNETSQSDFFVLEVAVLNHRCSGVGTVTVADNE
ncbi:hypothetical protein HanIR_Chr01g0031421 [Helianthus annuus]|nr:hypothetical protein HanIR_Chr01g0031421 [Helianthus annuus]